MLMGSNLRFKQKDIIPWSTSQYVKLCFLGRCVTERCRIKETAFLKITEKNVGFLLEGNLQVERSTWSKPTSQGKHFWTSCINIRLFRVRRADWTIQENPGRLQACDLFYCASSDHVSALIASHFRSCHLPHHQPDMDSQAWHKSMTFLTCCQSPNCCLLFVGGANHSCWSVQNMYKLL